MEIAKIVEIIALAKQDNARWLQYANDLILGHEIHKESIPTYSDKCTAYQWLYEHSQEISQTYYRIQRAEVDSVEFDIIDHVEILRYELQDLYLQIFKCYLPQVNNAFFSHLFHLKKQVSEDEQREAAHALKEMRNVVGELDEMLDRLELSYRQVCGLDTA